MSTGTPRLGPIGDLVLLIAGLGQAVARGDVHLGQVVIHGQDELAASDVAAHRHAFVNGEQVAGQVIWLQADRSVQRGLPLLE